MILIRRNLYYILVTLCCCLGNLAAEDAPICTTPICQITAQFLQENMNPSVQACDNFYQYACGGYVKKMKDKIPLGTNMINVTEETVAGIKQTILKYLQINDLEAPVALKKARDLFKSCTNNEARESLGLLPLDVILRHANLPLKPPFIGDSATDIDVSKVIGSTRQFMHINFPFVIAVVTDPNDKMKTRLEIRNPKPQKNSVLIKRSITITDDDSSNTDDNEHSDEDDDSSYEDENHEDAKQVDDKGDDDSNDANDQNTSAASSDEEEGKSEMEEKKRLEDIKRIEEIKQKEEEEEKQAKNQQAENEENQSSEEEKKKEKKKTSVEKTSSRKKEGTSNTASDTKRRESQKADESKKKEKPESRPSSRRRQWIDAVLDPFPEIRSQYTPSSVNGSNRRRPIEQIVYGDSDDELGNPSYNSVLQAEEPASIKPRGLGDDLPILTKYASLRKTSSNGTDQQQNGGNTETTSASTKKTSKEPQKIQKIIETENDHKPLAQFMADAAVLMYKHLGIDINTDGGVDALRSAASETAQLLHNIEKVVSKINPSKVNGMLLNLKQLQEKTDSWSQKKGSKPMVDWSLLFDKLLEMIPHIRDQFQRDRQIYIEDMKSFEEIMKLLSSVSTKTLVSALWWEVIRAHTLDTTEEMQKLEENYRNEIGQNVESRAEYCAVAVTKMLPFAVVWNYLNHSFTKDILQNQVPVITTGVYSSLDFMINEQRNRLLGMKTVMAASHKLRSFRWTNICSIGNANELNAEYKLVIPHHNNFFFSRFIYDSTRIRSEFEALNEKIDLDEYTPLDTDIKLSIQENRMTLPLAYFFYPGTGLLSTLFGSLGVHLARSEMHTFDLLGNEYNIWGKKKSWWKKSEVKEYLKKAECYVQSYEKLCFKEANNQCVDGRRTLHENIADSVGFAVAVHAYNLSVDPNKPQARLINFETFSPLQLLTLAFANTMCQVQTDTALSEILRTGKHPPPEARINGMFKNSPVFQSIWKCGEHKPMNPKDKCVIWENEVLTLKDD